MTNSITHAVLSNPFFPKWQTRAAELLRQGPNAGNTYAEVWIPDSTTASTSGMLQKKNPSRTFTSTVLPFPMTSMKPQSTTMEAQRSSSPKAMECRAPFGVRSSATLWIRKPFTALQSLCRPAPELLFKPFQRVTLADGEEG